MTPEKFWYVKNLKIFEGIPEQKIKEITTDSMLEMSHKKNTILYFPNENKDTVYFVKKGEVILYHSKDGKKNIFDILGPGSIFGGINFNEEKNNHFAETRTDSFICTFRKNDFLKLVSTFPQIMINLLYQMGSRIEDYEKKFENNLQSAEEIVLSELKRLAQKNKNFFFKHIMPRPLRATHEELAEITGLNRVTVTKAMKKLQSEKKILVDPQSKIIEIL